MRRRSFRRLVDYCENCVVTFIGSRPSLYRNDRLCIRGLPSFSFLSLFRSRAARCMSHCPSRRFVCRSSTVPLPCASPARMSIGGLALRVPSIATDGIASRGAMTGRTRATVHVRRRFVSPLPRRRTRDESSPVYRRAREVISSSLVPSRAPAVVASSPVDWVGPRRPWLTRANDGGIEKGSRSRRGVFSNDSNDGDSNFTRDGDEENVRSSVASSSSSAGNAASRAPPTSAASPKRTSLGRKVTLVVSIVLLVATALFATWGAELPEPSQTANFNRRHDHAFTVFLGALARVVKVSQRSAGTPLAQAAAMTFLVVTPVVPRLSRTAFNNLARLMASRYGSPAWVRPRLSSFLPPPFTP